jgi:serine phosphatase RsbU (regulator of sigma subunit)
MQPDADDDVGHTIIQRVVPGAPAPARPESAAYFIAYDAAPEDGGGTRRLRVGPVPLRIGRRAPCELLLRDGQVSSQHCQIAMQEHAVVVSDLGSTNGTWLDGERVLGPVRWRSGSALRIGQQLVRLEWRNLGDVERAEELDRDLERARRYVQSLLPPPLAGGPLAVDWLYEPSAQVGGDGFGYFALDGHRSAGYLIDVCGHGVGAAMHGVAVLNTLRQRALPGADFAQPAQVLAALNEAFAMERHGGMFFTVWYGVYDARDRSLAYASAGHHPGYVLPAAGGAAQALRTPNVVIGAVPEARFAAARVTLDAGDRLVLFSDGVFEISTRDGTPWGLDDLVRMLQADETTDPRRLYRAVRDIARPGPLDDDFCMLVMRVS